MNWFALNNSLLGPPLLTPGPQEVGMKKLRVGEFSITPLVAFRFSVGTFGCVIQFFENRDSSVGACGLARMCVCVGGGEVFW